MLFLFIPLFVGSKTPISKFGWIKEVMREKTVRKRPIGEG
ncbi:hypothetical protein B4083_5148 [Bacillus cereus]|nr:hypothetical protein B4083_5148 [Bacillus cereus]